MGGLTRQALGSLQEMMKRISKSAPLAQWNAAMLKLRSLEAEIGRAKDDKAIEVRGQGGEAETLGGATEPRVDCMSAPCRVTCPVHTTFCTGRSFLPYLSSKDIARDSLRKLNGMI